MSKKDKRAELIRQATAAAERAFRANFEEGEYNPRLEPGGYDDYYWELTRKSDKAEAEFRRRMDKLLEVST